MFCTFFGHFKVVTEFEMGARSQNMHSLPAVLWTYGEVRVLIMIHDYMIPILTSCSKLAERFQAIPLPENGASLDCPYQFNSVRAFALAAYDNENFVTMSLS